MRRTTQLSRKPRPTWGAKRSLIEKNVAPRQQLDQATAVFKAAQQTVEADQAVLQADRLKLGYAKLEAPIAGRVGAIRVTPGNLVSVNDATGLVTITQIQPDPRRLYSGRARSGCLAQGVRGFLACGSACLHSGIEHARSRPACSISWTAASIPASGTISAKAQIRQRKPRAVAGDVRGCRDRSRCPAQHRDDPGRGHPKRSKGRRSSSSSRTTRRSEMRNVELVGIEGDRAAREIGRGGRGARHRRGADAPDQRCARRRGSPDGSTPGRRSGQGCAERR